MEGKLVQELGKLVHAGKWERAMSALRGCLLGGFTSKDLPFRPLHQLLVSHEQWSHATQVLSMWESCDPSALGNGEAVTLTMDQLLKHGRWEEASKIFLMARGRQASREFLRNPCRSLLSALAERPGAPMWLVDLLTVYSSLSATPAAHRELYSSAVRQGYWSTALALAEELDGEQRASASAILVMRIMVAADALIAVEAREQNACAQLMDTVKGVFADAAHWVAESRASDNGLETVAAHLLTLGKDVCRLVKTSGDAAGLRTCRSTLLHQVRGFYGHAPAEAAAVIAECFTQGKGSRSVTTARGTKRVSLQPTPLEEATDLEQFAEELGALCSANSTWASVPWQPTLVEAAAALSTALQPQNVVSYCLKRSMTDTALLHLCAAANGRAFALWGVEMISKECTSAVMHAVVQALFNMSGPSWSEDVARRFGEVVARSTLLAGRPSWVAAVSFCSAARDALAEQHAKSDNVSVMKEMVELIVHTGGPRKWDHALQICGLVTQKRAHRNVQHEPELTETEIIDIAERCAAVRETHQWELAAEMFARHRNRIRSAQLLVNFDFAIRRSIDFAALVADHMQVHGLCSAPTATSILVSAKRHWKKKSKIIKFLAKKEVARDVDGIRKVAQRETMQIVEKALGALPKPMPLRELSEVSSLVAALAAECNGGDVSRLMRDHKLVDAAAVKSMQEELDRSISLCAEASDAATAVKQYSDHRSKCPFVPLLPRTFITLLSFSELHEEVCAGMIRDCIQLGLLDPEHQSDTSSLPELIAALLRAALTNSNGEALVGDILREVTRSDPVLNRNAEALSTELLQGLVAAPPDGEQAAALTRWAHKLTLAITSSSTVPFSRAGRCALMLLRCCTDPDHWLDSVSDVELQDHDVAQTFAKALKATADLTQIQVDSRIDTDSAPEERSSVLYSSRSLIFRPKERNDELLRSISRLLSRVCKLMHGYIQLAKATPSDLQATSTAFNDAAQLIETFFVSGLSPLSLLWREVGTGSLVPQTVARVVEALVAHDSAIDIWAKSSYSALSSWHFAQVRLLLAAAQLEIPGSVSDISHLLAQRKDDSSAWAVVATAVVHALSSADRTLEAFLQLMKERLHLLRATAAAAPVYESLQSIALSFYSDALSVNNQASKLVGDLVTIFEHELMMATNLRPRLLLLLICGSRSKGATSLGLTLGDMLTGLALALGEAASRSAASLTSMCSWCCACCIRHLNAMHEGSAERERALVAALEIFASEVPFRTDIALQLIREVEVSVVHGRAEFSSRTAVALLSFGPWPAHAAADLVLQCLPFWSDETKKKVLTAVELTRFARGRALWTANRATGMTEWGLQHYRVERSLGAAHLAILADAEKAGTAIVDINSPLNIAHKLLFHKLPTAASGTFALRFWFDSISSQRHPGVRWTDYLGALKHSRHPFLNISAMYNIAYCSFLIRSQTSHEMKWKVLRNVEVNFLRVAEPTEVPLWPPVWNGSDVVPSTTSLTELSALERFAAAASDFGPGLTPTSAFDALASSCESFSDLVRFISQQPSQEAAVSFFAAFVTLRAAARQRVAADDFCEFTQQLLLAIHASFGELKSVHATRVASLLFLTAAVYSPTTLDPELHHRLAEACLLMSSSFDDFWSQLVVDGQGLCNLKMEEILLFRRAIEAHRDNPRVVSQKVLLPWVPKSLAAKLIPQTCTREEAIALFGKSRSSTAAALVVRTLLSEPGKALRAFVCVDRFMSTGHFDTVQNSGRRDSLFDQGIAQEVVDTFFEELYQMMTRQPSQTNDMSTTLRLSVGRIVNGFGLRDIRGDRPHWGVVPRRSLQEYLRILVATRRLTVMDSTACDHILATLRMEQHESTTPGTYRSVTETHVLLRFFITALRHFLRTVEPDDVSLASQELSASCAFNALLEYLLLLQQRCPNMALLEQASTSKAIVSCFGSDAIALMKMKDSCVTPSTLITFLGGALRRREIADNAIAKIVSDTFSPQSAALLTSETSALPAGFVLSAIQLSRVLHWFVFNGSYDEVLTYFLNLGSKRPFVLLAGAVNSIAVAALHTTHVDLIRAAVDEVVRGYQFHLAEVSTFSLICFTWLHFHFNLAHVLWWLLRQWRRVPAALVQVTLGDLPVVIRDKLLEKIESELVDLSRDVMLDAPLQHLHAILEPSEGQRRRALFTQLTRTDKISWRRAAYILRREQLHDPTYHIEKDSDLAAETIAAVARGGGSVGMNAMWAQCLSLVVKLHSCQSEKISPKLLVATTVIVSASDAVCSMQMNVFLAKLLLASSNDVKEWLVPFCRHMKKVQLISGDSESMSALASVVKLALRHMSMDPELTAFVDSFLVRSSITPHGLLALLGESPVALPRQTVIAVGNRLHEAREHEVLLRFLDLACADRTALQVLKAPIEVALSMTFPDSADAARQALTMDVAGKSIRDMLDNKDRGDTAFTERFASACRGRKFEDAAAMLLHHPKILHAERTRDCLEKLASAGQYATIIQLAMPLLSLAVEQDRSRTEHVYDALGSVPSIGAVTVLLKAFLERRTLSTTQHRACGLLVAASFVTLSLTLTANNGDLSTAAAKCLDTSKNQAFFATFTSALKIFSAKYPLSKIGANLPKAVLFAATAHLVEHDPSTCSQLLSDCGSDRGLECRRKYCQAFSESLRLISDGSLGRKIGAGEWFEALGALHAQLRFSPSSVSKGPDSYSSLSRSFDETSSPSVICRVIEFARNEMKLSGSTLKALQEQGAKSLHRIVSSPGFTIDQSVVHHVIRESVQVLRDSKSSGPCVELVMENLLCALQASTAGNLSPKRALLVPSAVLTSAYHCSLAVAELPDLSDHGRVVCLEAVSLIRSLINSSQLTQPEASWTTALKLLRANVGLSKRDDLATRQFEALISLVGPSSSALRQLCTQAALRKLTISDRAVTALKISCVAHSGNAWQDQLGDLAKLFSGTASLRPRDEELLRQSLRSCATWDEAVGLISLHRGRGVRLSSQVYDMAAEYFSRAKAETLVSNNVVSSVTRARCADWAVPLSKKYCADCCAVLNSTGSNLNQLQVLKEFASWCEGATPVGAALEALCIVFDTGSSLAERPGTSIVLGEVGLRTQSFLEKACALLRAEPSISNDIRQRVVQSMLNWIAVTVPLLPPDSSWKVALAVASTYVTDQSLTSLLQATAQCSLSSQCGIVRAVAPLFKSSSHKWAALASMSVRNANVREDDLPRFLHWYRTLQQALPKSPTNEMLMDVTSGCFDGGKEANWVGALSMFWNAVSSTRGREDLTPALNDLLHKLGTEKTTALEICADQALAAGDGVVCLDADGLTHCALALAKCDLWHLALKMISCDNVAVPKTLRKGLIALVCEARSL